MQWLFSFPRVGRFFPKCVLGSVFPVPGSWSIHILMRFRGIYAPTRKPLCVTKSTFQGEVFSSTHMRNKAMHAQGLTSGATWKILGMPGTQRFKTTRMEPCLGMEPCLELIIRWVHVTCYKNATKKRGKKRSDREIPTTSWCFSCMKIWWRVFSYCQKDSIAEGFLPHLLLPCHLFLLRCTHPERDMRLWTRLDLQRPGVISYDYDDDCACLVLGTKHSWRPIAKPCSYLRTWFHFCMLQRLQRWFHLPNST